MMSMKTDSEMNPPYLQRGIDAAAKAFWTHICAHTLWHPPKFPALPD